MSYKLPMLPGYHSTFKEPKERYGIGSKLYVQNKVCMVTPLDEKKEDRTVNPDMVQVMLTNGLDVTNKPSWMVFGKETLTFDAYFKVSANECQFNYNVRKCKIVYFPEDNTITVMEPAIPNSGMTQGCLIRRHRIPRPGRVNGFYELLDFNVGKTVELYSKVFKITGVDCYTRDVLRKMGLDVPENQTEPKDPYFDYRAKVIRKVLSFKAFWDDRQSAEGLLHFMEVHYFLLDDTMAIMEIDEDDKMTMFLQRQRIPKQGPFLKPIGYDEENQILKVMGTGTDLTNQWFAMDPLHSANNVAPTYYNDSDLYIGAQIHVYNRIMVLTDCDEFTKEYYKSVYGLESFASIVPPRTQKQKAEDELKRIRNETLIKSRGENILKRLRSKATNFVFMFKAKMISSDPVNESRDFLIKYFFYDDTFGIYEITQRNSGVPGGQFRSKRSILTSDISGKSFMYNELVVGSTVFIDDFQFVLTDICEKTLKFMIGHPKEFYHSNLSMLYNQLHDLINSDGSNVDIFYEKCFQNRPLVPREEFRRLMYEHFKRELGQHTVAVFAFVYKKNEPYKTVSDELYRRVIQNELRRVSFRNFDGLEISMKTRLIRSDDGKLSAPDVMEILKTNKVPLTPELRSQLVRKFINIEDGRVRIKELIDFIDYMKYPTEVPYGVAKEILMVKPEVVYIKVGELVEFMRSFQPAY